MQNYKIELKNWNLNYSILLKLYKVYKIKTILLKMIIIYKFKNIKWYYNLKELIGWFKHKLLRLNKQITKWN